VDLERASPIVAMQVLRHGRLLVDANPRRRHQAVSNADIVVLNLQRAVQTAIDLATHVVSAEGYATLASWRPLSPDTSPTFVRSPPA